MRHVSPCYESLRCLKRKHSVFKLIKSVQGDSFSTERIRLLLLIISQSGQVNSIQVEKKMSKVKVHIK